MTLWTNETAQQATGGKAQGTWAASRVVIDSRSVQLGDLFVAIKGERVDSHQFVAEAFSRGAVAAVVSNPHPLAGSPPSPLKGEGWGEGSLLIVDDTLVALAAMGRFARARSNAKIVGVTGSVGKTSTKEMLKIALSAHGKTYATSGNYNNHIGTPLNLANFPEDCAFGVFEMGMNHAGEIRHLVEMVRPHVAVITNVEAVHLEFFKDVQGIADAKAEIFEHRAAPATAILNADNSFYDYLAEKARAQGITNIRSFGEKAGSSAQLMEYCATASGAEVIVKICHSREGGNPAASVGEPENSFTSLAAVTGSRVDSSRFALRHGMTEETLSFTLGATGKHFAKTALTALLVADTLKLPLPKTAAALADFVESDGRGKLLSIKVSGGNAWLIDDAYNASPASMRAAIAKADEVWQQRGKKGRKIAALGEMRELGETAAVLHAGLADLLVAHGFYAVFTACGLMQHLANALPESLRAAHVSEASELLPHLQTTLQPDDILLVKGSHGSKMYELSSQLTVGS